MRVRLLIEDLLQGRRRRRKEEREHRLRRGRDGATLGLEFAATIVRVRVIGRDQGPILRDTKGRQDARRGKGAQFVRGDE
jgi:hypothetical protein